MYRYEPNGGEDNVFVRYDGTETRVDIRRGGEGKGKQRGLTVDELRELRDVLTHALRRRVAFERRKP